MPLALSPSLDAPASAPLALSPGAPSTYPYEPPVEKVSVHGLTG